jgi:hypothetical protein
VCSSWENKVRPNASTRHPARLELGKGFRDWDLGKVTNHIQGCSVWWCGVLGAGENILDLWRVTEYTKGQNAIRREKGQKAKGRVGRGRETVMERKVQAECICFTELWNQSSSRDTPESSSIK